MRRYAIVIEDVGTILAAYVPDLPGRVASVETEAEVDELNREAIAWHLEGMATVGLPIPKASGRAEHIEVSL